jgi:Fur family ferric uptake transcriptional regulator
VARRGTRRTRMSKSATRVLQTLEHAGGFASAQEVHQLIARQGDRIGLTTIYRALQSLQKEKLVDVLRRDDGEAIYRLCGEGHHHHLVCKKCGRTLEIEGGAIEKWAESVAIEHGFRDIGHSAEIFGTCSKC